MPEKLIDEKGVEFNPAIHVTNKNGKPKKAFGKFFIVKEDSGDSDVSDVIASLAGKKEEVKPLPKKDIVVNEPEPVIEIDDEPQMDDEVVSEEIIIEPEDLPRVSAVRDMQNVDVEIIQKMAQQAMAGPERKRIDFSAGYDLRGLDMSGSDIRSALMQNCDLTGTNCTNVNAEGINLTGSKVKGSIWKGANLKFAILPIAFKTEAIFDETTQLQEAVYR